MFHKSPHSGPDECCIFWMIKIHPDLRSAQQVGPRVPFRTQRCSRRCELKWSWIISSSFGLIFPFNSMPLFQPYLNIKPYRWGSCKKMECPWSKDVARGWIWCDMQQLTVDPLEHWPVLGFMLNFKGLVIKNFERHGFLFLNNYPFNKPCFLFESFISGRLPGWSIDMGAKTLWATRFAAHVSMATIRSGNPLLTFILWICIPKITPACIPSHFLTPLWKHIYAMGPPDIKRKVSYHKSSTRQVSLARFHHQRLNG